MLELLAKQYAQLKGTKVIAMLVKGDQISFVVEAGAKLLMTAEELQAEIDKMQAERPMENIFEYIEKAVEEESPKPKRKGKGKNG